MGANPNITMEIILGTPERFWDSFYLAYNPSITLKDIVRYPDYNWDWHIISSDMLLDGLTNAHLQNPLLKWNFNLLSSSRYVTMEMIDANPDIPWNWHGISSNPNLTLGYVLRNAMRPWDWEMLCYSLPLHGSLHVIRQLPFWRMDMMKLSYNTSLTLDDVLGNADLEWCWLTLSQHILLQENDIRRHAGRPLSWENLSGNRSLRLHMIDPIYPWSWVALSANKFDK
jgi:hypothetical protein